MGAGLLANTVDQLINLYLAHRIREQARSHIFNCISGLELGVYRQLEGSRRSQVVSR